MGEAANRTSIKSYPYQFLKLIGRMPFSLCMVVILLLVAWWTNSYYQALTHSWMSRLGFAPRDLWFLRWWRLILSALVTSGGTAFWLALFMVGFTSGVAEWLKGTWRAVVAFWGVHVVTLVSEALIFTLPLHQLGFTQAHGVFFSRDVGPSAGYMGSLGCIITFLPKPWRWGAFGVILAYLIAAFFFPASAGISPAIKLSDDMAHLIAFPLGWLSASLGRKEGTYQTGENMPDKTIAQKLSLKPGGKLMLVNPPEGYAITIGDLPAGGSLVDEPGGIVDAIQVFVANRTDLESRLPQLKRQIKPNGMLWVTYHKGTSKVKTDINRDSIVAYAQTLGMQGVAMISIDDDWAALRLKLV